jgi:death-on-curing family protein
LLNYLSVHDFVWINSTITGKTVPFDYESLEASMAAQYSYGESNDALGQAANMLETMLTKRPFESGNVRTAFIATVTFLTANKYELQLHDKEAVDILKRTSRGELPASAAVTALFRPSDLGLRSDSALRALVTYICNEHSEALQLLTEGD